MASRQSKAEQLALYLRWGSMWNGQLEISDEIIAEKFVAHLSADAAPPPQPVHDARSLREWIVAIRSRTTQMIYRVEVGPLVDGDRVVAYWRATGALTTVDGRNMPFAKVGMDILRVNGNRFVEYWTMNNSAQAD
jgi:SnoaL-like domain